MTQTKSTVGKLYILPPSPWSRRVLLALCHLRTVVEVHEYKPMITELFLRIRAGWPSHIITGPALLTPAGRLICESHDISRLLDASRAPNASTLFPAQYDEKLRKLVDAAEVITIYTRAKGIKYYIDNPKFGAKLFFPKFMLGFPGISYMTTVILRKVKKKYDYLNDSGTEQKTRAALDDIRKTLKESNGQFLIGDTLTYADIVVAGALGMLICDDKTSEFEKPPFDEFDGDYDDVKAWGDAFLAEYVTPETIAFPPRKYDAQGNVVS